MRTHQQLLALVQSTVIYAHSKLVTMGLTGKLPATNVHKDRDLPAAIYQPRTDTIACSSPKLCALGFDEARSAILDAMACCGAHRKYRIDMGLWNLCQNKARMQQPVLMLQGSTKWLTVRDKL